MPQNNMQALYLVGGTVLLVLLIIILFSCIAKLLMRRKRKKTAKRLHYSPAKLRKLAELQLKRLDAQGYLWKRGLFEDSDYLVWGAAGVFHISFVTEDCDTWIATALPEEIEKLREFLHMAVSYADLPFMPMMVTTAREPITMRKGELDEQGYMCLNPDDIADVILRKKQTVFRESDRKILNKAMKSAYKRYSRLEHDVAEV